MHHACRYSNRIAGYCVPQVTNPADSICKCSNLFLLEGRYVAVAKNNADRQKKASRSRFLLNRVDVEVSGRKEEMADNQKIRRLHKYVLEHHVLEDLMEKKVSSLLT